MKQQLINKNLFIDRVNEQKLLLNGLKNGSDYVLIAPRRYGKTTLVNKVFSNLSHDKNYIPISIDVMRYSGSIRNLAVNIADKCLALMGLSGKLYSMLSKVELSLKLKLSWGEIEIEPILNLLKSTTDEDSDLKLLEHSLELFEKIAIKKNKLLVVFFDEFGELYHLGDQVIKVFRSVLQLSKNVSYVFAGSQETLMTKIFIDKNSAFFRFGTVIYLDVLNKQEVIEYFELAKFKFEIADKILQIFECHPYYTSKAIHDLFNNPELSQNASTFNQYIDNLLTDERAYLDMLIKKINTKSNSLDVLSNIARGLVTNFGMEGKSRQYISNVITTLYKDGYLKKTASSKYDLTDPLLKIYLVS